MWQISWNKDECARSFTDYVGGMNCRKAIVMTILAIRSRILLFVEANQPICNSFCRSTCPTEPTGGIRM